MPAGVSGGGLGAVRSSCSPVIWVFLVVVECFARFGHETAVSVSHGSVGAFDAAFVTWAFVWILLVKIVVCVIE